MARIENTVFISYRRTDVYTALAVYENLKNQGYDVFFDYRSISSGDFSQIITSNIRARAHFVLILTPTALDRCNEPGDWLRREIELAIDEKRNIVPLFFKGFRFGDPNVKDKLTGTMQHLSSYNGLNVHEDYFDEAMQRLRTQYLNIPLDTVLHPVSSEVQKVVVAEQVAADKALEQIEDVRELVKQSDEKPVQLPEPEPMPKLSAELAVSLPEAKTGTAAVPTETPKPTPKMASLESEMAQSQPAPRTSAPNLNPRLVGGIATGILLIALFIWGIPSLLKQPAMATLEPTLTSQPEFTKTSVPAATSTVSVTETSAPPTTVLGIGSTMTGKDGMTLLYVLAGEFTMGSSDSNVGNIGDEPVHKVDLDAFWIDKTEVTNAMYAQCVADGVCNDPINKSSSTHSTYYGNPAFDNYPVIYVDWNMAKTYCEWAGRRLPTEAEWEKAARGTDGRKYPWGNNLPDKNLLNNNGTDTTEVDKYSAGASPYGVLNMAGNVVEWVADWYSDTYYASSPISNPMGPSSGQYRVLRGGSWLSDNNYVRSADRSAFIPTESSYVTGFRCAVSATP